MDNIQALVDTAQEFKNTGRYREALMCYGDIMDLLVREANGHARKQEGSHTDMGKIRVINTKFFEESRKFLKQDMTAAIISNNMASLYARLGDFENAKKMFEDSIDLTPDGEEYNDPKIGLKELL